MSQPETFLAQCVTLPEFAKLNGKSHLWAYNLRESGLPVLKVKGLHNLVHLPTANQWLNGRLRSRGRKYQPEAA